MIRGTGDLVSSWGSRASLIYSVAGPCSRIPLKRHLLSLIAVLATVLSSWGQTDTEHVRLTNLPHVYVNTFTGRSITSKTTPVLARMWYVDEDDAVTFHDSVEVRVRGNSTATLPKKPYKLKFPEKLRLLGKDRAKAKKWTLLANHGDKTLLRNALTSLMGERAGLPFNPAAKFVDLTVNGEYVGNYQISDQVEVRKKRVDVVEQDYPLTEASDVSGGYLLEADGFKDYTDGLSGFSTNRSRAPIRIHYPDEDEIDHRQYLYIQRFVQNFEDILMSADFADPVGGYRPYVDSVSLANWYICTEVSANVDGFFSTYFYKNQYDDRLYWGPLWDYDIAYNNDNRTDRGGTSNTERQLMKDYSYGSSFRQWIRRMWEDPWFARLINRRYKELVDEGLEDYLNAKLDSLTTLIDASQQLNYQRWGINNRALRERVLYSTYDQYVADVRTFLNRHIAFLTEAFADLLPDVEQEGPDVIVPDFKADASSYYAIVNANTGTCFDVDMQTDEVCCRHRDNDSESQQWQVMTLQSGYLFIVNRATGQALTDPSPADATATTHVGQALTVAAADSADLRQHWNIISQGDGRYNIVSRWSEHAANLSGGNSSDGTRVISYTSDGRNSTSGNRLWRIEEAGKVEETALDDVSEDYVLAYDPTTGRLHFGADRREALSFMVSIYNTAGRRIATFRATDDFSMLSLPSSLYMISWHHQGRQHSVKLMKEP